ncbi:hypothetical protein PT2222_10423 [Paraburkholderia tropica]
MSPSAPLIQFFIQSQILCRAGFARRHRSRVIPRFAGVRAPHRAGNPIPSASRDFVETYRNNYFDREHGTMKPLPTPSISTR